MVARYFRHPQAIHLLLPLAFILLFLCAGNAAAGVTRDGTLGPAGPLAGPNYQIADTDGTRAGTNLFHSFSQFNIGTGESATFTNSGAPLNNVIARITGGASTIDGLIRSTIDGANLFLLNPAGVMFGPNASIDVPGSFHVSTADYLKFNDDGKFYANTSSPSVLSVADPAAFGFLGSNPAAIVGDRAYLQVAEGKTLSIVGGDVTYAGTPVGTNDLPFIPAVLNAPGGTINLISVASPGEVSLAGMATDTFSALGTISLFDGAKLSVINIDENWLPKSAGGTVVIRGGTLIFRDGGIDAYGNPGGVIDVKGTSLHLDNYYFFPANFNWGFDPSYATIDHPGTACSIGLAGDFLMTHASFIDTQNIGAGRGGNTRIQAKNIILGDEIIDPNSYTDIGFHGYIGSTTVGSGRGGNIDMIADNMTVRNGFFVKSEVNHYDAILYPGTGEAGDMTVTVANTLSITDQGIVGSMANGLGRGGNLTISAHDILISAEHETEVTRTQVMTGILGQTSYLSNGGQIKINADKLQLLDGGQISTVLYDLGLGEGASGKGADISIDAGDMVISGYVVDNTRPGDPFYYSSSVDARVYNPEASGTGGNITIQTDSLTLTNGGNIRSGLDFGASGNAGDINIQATTIDINTLGRIYADSNLGTGNSGNIGISAQSMHISGTSEVLPSGPPELNFTGLSTSTKAGDIKGKGAINVNLSDDLTMNAAGVIKADTSGDAQGGTINIKARNISLNNKASINAASTSDGDDAGDAGNIAITAANTLTLRDSSITTEASRSKHADGGNITISVPYMVRLIDSWITSSVGGGPETTGGNIFIDPQFVILQNSQIIANAYEGTGGNITIIADLFLQDPWSTVSASSALGIDGTVDIQAPISNISGVIAPLASTYSSATDLLRERCIARIREGKYSSFIVGGRDGLPAEPGSLMPSISY